MTNLNRSRSTKTTASAVFLRAATVERMVEPLEQRVAVGQVGQGVVAGEVADAGFVALAIGQVAQGEDGRGTTEEVDRVAG